MTTWVAMVQKEVGQRLAAKPGTSAYGAPSVLAQLACDVRVLRPVSRTVFHPVPNVDSVLVGLTRRGPAPEPALRALVQPGLRPPAQGARPLARPRARRRAGDPRPRARRAGRHRPPAGRARRAARPGRVARPPRGAVAMRRMRAAAPGKVNLCLFIGRAAPGRVPPARVPGAARLVADELELEPAHGDADEVVCPGVDGREPRRPRARPLPRGDRLGRPARPRHDRQARPGRRRHGRRLGRRRRRAAARRRRRRARPQRRRRCTGSRSALGADVPSQLAPERCLMTGIGEGVRRLGDPAPFGLLIVPSAHALSHRRRSTREFDRLGLGRDGDELDRLSGQVPGAARADCAARRAPAPQRPRGAARARSARRSATRSPTSARPARCARWCPAPARRCSASSPAPTASTHARAAADALRARHPRRRRGRARSAARSPRRGRSAACTPPGSPAAIALALYLVVAPAPRTAALRSRSARSRRPARC